MLIKASILSVPVSLGLIYSIFAFGRRRTVPSLLHLLGAAALLVVVLTHVAEALRLVPAMGWGDPHSIGHYISPTSAVGGAVFFAAGGLLRVRAKMA